MALDLPRPAVPGLDENGVLDIEALNQEALRVICKATSAAAGKWLHAFWQGTDSSGKASDLRGDSRLLFSGEEPVPFEIPFILLRGLDQGHAVVSYTVQPNQDFEHGHEESDRVNILVGTRNFPGAGLNVASIREAHELQLNETNVSGSGAMVAVPPWQAMQAGDKVVMTWKGFRDNGGNAVELVLDHDVVESEVGLPVGFEIPRATLARTPRGTGLLSYEIKYANGGLTPSPVQRFTVLPAPTDLLPALRILEHGSGGPIDPGLVSNGLTFSIEAYAQLQEGDSLIISIEDTATNLVEFITGIRLDRSSVDSGLLHAKVQGDWLEDYLDRDIALRYQVARPGMGLGGEPLALSVRAPMNLPVPVVDSASGVGEAEGEFKAGDAGDGIRIRVPSKAVYPAGAQVQMHWEGFPGSGSEIVTVSDGSTPPTFVVSPSVVAPNIGKVVKVFYRVTVSGDMPRDSQVFSLKVLPIPVFGYPTLSCVEAVNNQLRVGNLPARGASLSVASWPLIALDHLVTLTAVGVMRNGLTDIKEVYKLPVASVTSPLQTYLEKTWLAGLALNSVVELTVSVTADGGETYIIFPRVRVTILA